MLLKRLTAGFSILGSLLLVSAQGIAIIADANDVTSAPEPVVIAIQHADRHDDHSHDEELLEASKGAAARRRLYTDTPVLTVPIPTLPEFKKQPLLPVVDQADIRENHRTIANETLWSIHSECRTTLKNFYVRYDNPEHRGLGGGGTIILSGNVPDDEFRALLVHECGHVIDTGAWKGTPATGATGFSDGNEPIFNDDPSYGFYTISWSRADQKKEGITEKDFVSGYASWNAFEDFAETFTYFTLHREEFFSRAQTNDVLMAKYRFMETHIEDNQPGVTEHSWKGDVPWDITKLPYRWLAGKSTTALSR